MTNISPEADLQERDSWLWSENKRLASECSELAAAVNQARQYAEAVEAENEDLHEMLRKRFCLTEDTDGHWYVIPVERLGEWTAFCCTSGEDEDAPDWARRVPGSPSLVIFGEYRIK